MRIVEESERHEIPRRTEAASRPETLRNDLRFGIRKSPVVADEVVQKDKAFEVRFPVLSQNIVISDKGEKRPGTNCCNQFKTSRYDLSAIARNGKVLVTLPFLSQTTGNFVTGLRATRPPQSS